MLIFTPQETLYLTPTVTLNRWRRGLVFRRRYLTLGERSRLEAIELEIRRRRCRLTLVVHNS